MKFEDFERTGKEINSMQKDWKWQYDYDFALDIDRLSVGCKTVLNVR